MTTKVSKWLADFGSHDIYNANATEQDFLDSTGNFASFPKHTVGDTKKAIGDRGLGGNIDGDDEDLVCYGWEIAEHLASDLAKFSSDKFGRGSRFRDSVAAIEAAGH